MMANAPDRFLTWRWVEEPDDENTPQYYDPQKSMFINNIIIII